MNKFRMGGVEFKVDTRIGSERGLSEKDSFILVKSDEMLEYYFSLKPALPKDIMEVGVFEGGSLVFLDKLFEPRAIVGLDVRRRAIPALDDYIAQHPHMKMFYGRSQDGPGTVMAARQNFKEGIDLVIDDASHHYDKSRVTFQMLFPLVRPGGTYVIEDWAWAHTHAQQQPHAWHDKEALTNLVFELVVMAAVHPVIESVSIKRGFAAVKKGRGRFSADMFDLSGALRGRELSKI